MYEAFCVALVRLSGKRMASLRIEMKDTSTSINRLVFVPSAGASTEAALSAPTLVTMVWHKRDAVRLVLTLRCIPFDAETDRLRCTDVWQTIQHPAGHRLKTHYISPSGVQTNLQPYKYAVSIQGDNFLLLGHYLQSKSATLYINNPSSIRSPGINRQIVRFPSALDQLTHHGVSRIASIV